MWSPGALDLPDASFRIVQLGPAQAPPLLVVPDPPNVLEHHRDSLIALATHRRVLACELPGFGRSRLRGPLTFDRVTAAMIALLDHLGLRDLTLETSCIGAHVGLRVAAARPDRVARLVLVQATTPTHLRSWAWRTDVSGILHAPILGPLCCRLARDRIVRHWYDVALPRGTDLTTRAAYTELATTALHAGGSFPLAHAYRALARLADPPRIEQPTLLVFGTADRTHARTDLDALTALLPRARLERVPGCGHFPNLEDPGGHARRIAEFAA